MFKISSRVVLAGLLATAVVGCGDPEPKVIVDKQTALELQAERDAQEKVELAQDAAARKADPNYDR